MTNFTTDEQTVLLIAARGERLIPIGRWKEPVESLTKRGFLVRERHAGDPTGHFNNVISPAGRAAVEELDTAYDEVAAVSQSIGNAHVRLRADAERIAAMMAALARESVAVTGETEVISLRNWTKVIVKRALEMVK